MRCVTPEEGETILGAGFAVNANGYLITPKVDGQYRVDMRPTTLIHVFADFANAVNRWLPDNVGRVLWLNRWHGGFHSAFEVILATRLAAGEARSVESAPGCLFEALPWHDYDVPNLPQNQQREVSLLMGLMILFMTHDSIGWLAAPETQDFVAFAEGNLFFYSANAEKLAEAEALAGEWQCSRDLV